MKATKNIALLIFMLCLFHSVRIVAALGDSMAAGFDVIAALDRQRDRLNQRVTAAVPLRCLFAAFQC